MSVVITGMGVVSALGAGIPEVLAALHAGRSAIRRGEAGVGAPISDFDASRYSNPRGMRVYNRATQLAISASALALSQARLDPVANPGQELGLVMASSYGHLETLCEYDLSLLTRGIERTNPAWMPLAIASAPGAAAALAFRARGASVTLSSGATSGLDALALAARLLAAGRVSACLVLSGFSPARDLLRSAAVAGWTAQPEDVCVLDAHSRGCALGEAGVAIVLETRASADARGVPSLGTLEAHAARFASSSDGRAHALAHAVWDTLRAEPGAELALVSCGANGIPAEDEAQACGLSIAMMEAAQTPIVTSLCGNLGDTVDASGLLQLALGLAALHAGSVPAIPKLDTPRVPGLRYAQHACAPISGALLVTSISHSGSAGALLVSAS